MPTGCSGSASRAVLLAKCIKGNSIIYRFRHSEIVFDANVYFWCHVVSFGGELLFQYSGAIPPSKLFVL